MFISALLPRSDEVSDNLDDHTDATVKLKYHLYLLPECRLKPSSPLPLRSTASIVEDFCMV